MSAILETLKPREPGQAGTYRVACAGCGRVYITTSHVSVIEKLATCQACRPRTSLRKGAQP